MIGISTVQFGLRLSLAIGMGAIVGLERQWRQRMAGTRTNALLAAVEGATARVGAEDLRIGDRIRLACPMFCTSEELV